MRTRPRNICRSPCSCGTAAAQLCRSWSRRSNPGSARLWEKWGEIWNGGCNIGMFFYICVLFWSILVFWGYIYIGFGYIICKIIIFFGGDSYLFGKYIFL